MFKAPPARYKIVERDRRLVTIDTWSGQVVTTGSAASTPAEAPRAAELDEDIAPPPSPRSPWSEPVERLENANPARARQGLQPQATDTRGVKIFALVIGGIIFALFLILSGAWIPFLIIAAIPAVRTPVWTALRRAVSLYLAKE